MRRPSVDPLSGIIRRDATADLKAPWPGGEYLAGSIVITLAQFDHVAAAQVVATVQFSIPRGRFFRDKIGAQGVRLSIVDGAPHDLFHPALMEVNARPKHVTSVSPLG